MYNLLVILGCLIPVTDSPPCKKKTIIILEKLESVSLLELLGDLMSPLENRGSENPYCIHRGRYIHRRDQKVYSKALMSSDILWMWLYIFSLIKPVDCLMPTTSMKIAFWWELLQGLAFKDQNYWYSSISDGSNLDGMESPCIVYFTKFWKEELYIRYVPPI